MVMVATGFTGGDPRKVDRAGDTMTGDLTLPADPDQPLEAATKQYVDAVAGGGGAGVPANTVSAETSFGIAAAAGAATTYSRGDHTHGSPAAPTAASVGADPAGSAAAAQAAAVASSLQRASNLSDLTNTTTARTNLGLGDSATLDVGTTAGTVAAGDDARLSDARAPTAHAATHASAGSDPVTLAQSQVTDLTTDLAAKIDASTLTTKGDLLVRNATVPDRQGVGGDGTVLTANSGTTTGVEWAAPATVARNTETWSRDGDATVTTGAMRWYNRTGSTRTIHGAWAAAGTAPVGAALIVDVHRDGTTIFTTQGNRPTVPDGGNGGALATPDVTTIADGSYLTVDIDQIGSGTAGADVTVGVVMS